VPTKAQISRNYLTAHCEPSREWLDCAFPHSRCVCVCVYRAECCCFYERHWL